jgi:hypothetical protein
MCISGQYIQSPIQTPSIVTTPEISSITRLRFPQVFLISEYSTLENIYTDFTRISSLSVIRRIIKVKLFLCLTNQELHHEGVWGNGCIDPHFLYLGTSCRWVVSFTPRPLYPRRRSPLNRRLGGPKVDLTTWRGKNFCPTGTWNSILRSSSP